MKTTQITPEEIDKQLKDIRTLLIQGNYTITEKLESVIKQSSNIHYHKGKAVAIKYLGSIYGAQSDHKKAIQYFLEAKLIADEHNIFSENMNLNLWLSSHYSFLGENSKAIEYGYKALELSESQQHEENKYFAQRNLGGLYKSINDLDKAEYYYLQALPYLEKSSEFEKGALWFSLGELYEFKNQNKLAREYFEKSLEISEKIDNKVLLVFGYSKLGVLMQNDNNFDDAIKFHKKSIVLAEQTNQLNDMYLSQIYLAKCYFESNELDKAQKLALTTLKKLTTEEHKSDAVDLLYKINVKQEKYKEALDYYKRYVEIKNRTQDIETKKHIETTEAQFQNKLKEREKEIFRLQKIEMEQKALRAQLNPHFIFNALNSIQKFIVANDNKNGINFLQKFSTLMRQTLENSEEAFIAVEDEIDFLNNYLSIEQLRFDFSFNYKIEMDEDIDAELFEIPSMLLQPYVENAIKHGVNGIENGEISIEFRYVDDKRIKCIIEDNGRGRNNTSKSQHTSMGTQILQNRIASLKEQYNLEFSVNIIDKTINEKAAGTRVEIVISDVVLT